MTRLLHTAKAILEFVQQHHLRPPRSIAIKPSVALFALLTLLLLAACESATPAPLPAGTPSPAAPFRASNVAVTGMTDLGEFSGAYGVWSPDGLAYAYTKHAGGVPSRDGRGGWELNDLWVVRSDASGNHLLVKNATSPAWDGDSRALYYFSFEPRDLDHALKNFDLHVVGVDG